MTITVLNQAAPVSRPTSIGSNSITTEYDHVYSFTVEDFTTLTTPAYSHPDTPSGTHNAAYIKIISLPSNGILELNQNQAGALEEGDTIAVGNISSGNFVYDPDSSIESANTVSFQFDVADNISNTLSGLSTGIMTLNTLAKPNLKPSQVGNGFVSIASGFSYSFTEFDFITDYVDPEGDPPYKLKVTSLPSQGNLVHNGLNVVQNQEILFSEIVEGYFVYVSPSNLLQITSFTFNFEISDEGSKQYTA
jgi:hypothetical protein